MQFILSTTNQTVEGKNQNFIQGLLAVDCNYLVKQILLQLEIFRTTSI